MTFTFDDFRIVYLRDKEQIEKVGHKFTRFASLRELLDKKPDDNYHLQNILTKEIAASKNEEWQNIVDNFKKNHSRDADPKVTESLRSSSSEDFLEKYESLQKKKIMPKIFLDNLKSEAEKIARRKTIFIFPTVKQGEAFKYQDIIDNIAEEVNGYLGEVCNAKDNHLTLSFAIETEELKQDEINLLDELVDRLLIKLNEGLFNVLIKHIDKNGPVLLEGPTGVGKTMFARLFTAYLKKKSEAVTSSTTMDRRHEVPFHQLNVTGIPETLIESRIRGTSKGVATDVVEMPGCFEIAHNGVLFLDEFQNAPEWVQTQLLDILDPLSNKVSIIRLGAKERRIWNVKVFLAVNKSVSQLIKIGKLREDFYHRIREVLVLPSFKELLNDHDQRKRGGVSKEGFLRKLIYIYRWKHPAKIHVEYPYKPFPTIKVNTIKILLAKTWEGNFREVEKKIADLLWDFDKGTEPKDLTIDNNDRTKLSEEIPSTKPEESNDDKLIRSEVESALKNNDYIYQKTLPELKIYHIGSSPTLRAYIRKNFDRFSKETQNNRRIQKTARKENQ